MKRSVSQIYQATSEAGATLDTGTINVEEFHTIYLTIEAATEDGDTAAVNVVDECGIEHLVFSDTEVPVASPLGYGIGREVGVSTAPVLRLMSFTAAASGQGTVTLTIWGVRDEPEP